MTRLRRLSAKSHENPLKPKGLYISKKGNWWYRIKRKGLAKEDTADTGLPATAQNIALALAIRATRLEELKTGKVVRKVQVPFSIAAVDFLKWYEGEHRSKPNTYKRANTSFASLIHHFASRLVNTIGSGDIEGFKTWRRSNYIKEVTIRHDLHNLSAFFQYGKKLGWCDSNPVEEVEIPSDKDAVRINVLSPEMEAQYFAAAKKRSKDLYDLGRIMILTGCRPDEVMKMTKADIDWFTVRFRVWGKSKASDRKLKMVGEVAEILKDRYHTKSKWVFPSPVFPDQHIATLQRAHDEVVETTGVMCTVYDFRHTFATRKAVEGCPIPILAALLGHSNLSCVMKYVHPNQAHMDEALEWSGDETWVPAKSGSRPTLDPLSRSKKAQFRLIRSNSKVGAK